jgi:hypothetical protein
LKRKANLLFIILIFIWVGISYGQSGVLTNEELVIKAVSQSVGDSISEIKSGTVYIGNDSVGVNHPISRGIIDAAQNKGFTVFLNNNQTVDYNAAYDILGFDFDYKKGKSRGFLKQSMIKRKLNALLRLTFKNHVSGEIKYSKDVAVKYEDEIEPDYLNYVASLKIKQLSPNEPASFVKRFAEPVIVTTAIGALVFLFFANR